MLSSRSSIVYNISPLDCLSVSCTYTPIVDILGFEKQTGFEYVFSIVSK